MDLRVAQPGPAVARGKPIAIRFNGKPVRAYEGETVGAALHAAGERALMRSIKYHRPRGLFCNVGKCAGCLVRVDGTPSVRACVTPARDGMEVETQNAFPSARRDLLGVIDRAYPRVLDTHTQMARVPLARPIHHWIVRRMAGFGKVPDLRPLPPRRPAIRRLDCDVLVVGGGASGLSAAVAAAEGATKVALVEESDRMGGSLLLEGEHARADELLARLHGAEGITHARATAFGAYLSDGVGERLAPPGVVAILTAERILEARPKALVVASGYHETPPLFLNNDLPGVMGARAALLLLHRHGILAGERVVVAGRTPLAQRAAEDMRKAGADVVAVVGEGEAKDAELLAVEGGDRVKRVTFESETRQWAIAADLVLTSGDETPRVELLQQVGARLVPHGHALAPEMRDEVRTTVDGVFAAGSVVGETHLAKRLEQGARAGEAAAAWARRRHG